MPTDKFFKLPQAKKDQITNAVINELKNNRYQDLSVNRLIAIMGISTGSFYLYFEDKKDLCSESGFG